MRPLTSREQRTLRIGGIGIAIYLLVFGGAQIGTLFEHKRADYQQLVRQARSLRQEIQVYEAKAEKVQKLMESFKMDPARLSSTTAVAQASAAIQKAATTSGIAIGPVRESPARPSSKELASIQMECTGPVPSVTALLGRLDSLGYPLVVDTVQFTAETARPGMVKMNLTIVILDFDQWKKDTHA